MVEKGKINSNVLNVLRVYATLVVFVCHSIIVGWEEFGLESWHGNMLLFNTPAWGGVWIFLALGGFLACYGFDQQKYSIDKEGILKYYKTRVVKVLIPTWIFLSLAYIASMNESHLSLTTLIQFLTCTFWGLGAEIKNVGASWYVFVVMWLYLLAPILYKGVLYMEEKNKGKELKSYAILLTIVCSIFCVYRIVMGYILKLDYFHWCFANLLGCFDLFLAGIAGCRIYHYLPKELDYAKLHYIKICLITLLILFVFIFSGWINQIEFSSAALSYCISKLAKIYRYLGPYLFSFTAIALVISYSYSTNNKETNKIKESINKIFNGISPYTFMFYLWHSVILAVVANKLTIENQYCHYFAMLALGAVVTAYVAWLMTKMNNMIIKELLK